MTLPSARKYALDAEPDRQESDLKAQLAAAEARAADEAAKTARAIAAFESLAERLEAIAASKRAIEPWWHRLLRTAG